jgi:hypothetical protein
MDVNNVTKLTSFVSFLLKAGSIILHNYSRWESNFPEVLS